MELLRTVGPLVLAVAAALYVDQAMERRGALPPRFDSGLEPYDARLRRALGTLVIAAILWAGAFAPLTGIGEPLPDPAELTIPRLFLLHGLLVVALCCWYAAGYLPRKEGWSWRQAFGLPSASAGRELAVGTAIGLAIWLIVLGVLLLLAGLVSLVGGPESLPSEPPAIVLWIGGLPILARVAIALSAGIVEETFFRGFLQPRIGVLASTALFVLAHVGYGQPFMLVGVAMLSLLYAELKRRRVSVWAPIAAHAVFDLVQLLVVVPLVSRAVELQDAPELVGAVAGGLLSRAA